MHYITYKQFNDIGLAEELGLLLKENRIDYVLEDATPHFDVSFANNRVNEEYKIKINPADFLKVNELLEEQARKQLSELPEDYYLYAFTDEELKDLLAKKDEWNALDVVLSRKILDERGVRIDYEVLDALERQRIEELSKPNEMNPSWLYLGFLFALLGGLLGIVIGWFISSNTKILPNGEVVPAYSEKDRNKGRWMLIVGIVVFVLSFIMQLKKIF